MEVFCGMPPSHAGSLARDCERSDPVGGDFFSISGTVLVAFARLFHRHSLQTREQEAPRCRPQEVCLRTPFSQRSVKRGYPQQCVGEEIGRKYNAQVVYCCRLCISCRNFGASNVARAAYSAGRHDHASSLGMRPR